MKWLQFHRCCGSGVFHGLYCVCIISVRRAFLVMLSCTVVAGQAPHLVAQVVLRKSSGCFSSTLALRCYMSARPLVYRRCVARVAVTCAYFVLPAAIC